MYHVMATYDTPTEVTIPVMADSADEAVEAAYRALSRRHNPEIGFVYPMPSNQFMTDTTQNDDDDFIIPSEYPKTEKKKLN